MHRYINKTTHIKNTGFTIVELLIVIVVIAILAAITIVAFNGIQQRSYASILKSDLTNASKQMELANVAAGGYPTTLPSAVKVSPNVLLSLSQATGGYCINGEMKNNPSVRWYFNSTSGGLQEGNCTGAVISGSENGMNPNLIINTDFSSGWMIQMQNSAGRTMIKRAGAPGDPYPNRPVLVLTNSATGSTAWAVLGSTALNRSAITSGKTYTSSYYVRKTGAYDSTIGPFGLLDGNGQNVTLPYNSNLTTVSADWQKISGTSNALQDAPSTNQLYIGVPTAPFAISGWTLEFQNFELREQ